MSNKKTTKKTAKKTAKKTRKKDFDFRAPKGKIRLHQIVVLTSSGNHGIWDVAQTDSMDHAIAEAKALAEIGPTESVVIYHLDTWLTLPAVPKPKRVAAKAKKIRAEPPKELPQPKRRSKKKAAVAEREVHDKGAYPIREGFGDDIDPPEDF